MKSVVFSQSSQLPCGCFYGLNQLVETPRWWNGAYPVDVKLHRCVGVPKESRISLSLGSSVKAHIACDTCFSEGRTHPITHRPPVRSGAYNNSGCKDNNQKLRHAVRSNNVSGLMQLAFTSVDDSGRVTRRGRINED